MKLTRRGLFHRIFTAPVASMLAATAVASPMVGFRWRDVRGFGLLWCNEIDPKKVVRGGELIRQKITYNPGHSKAWPHYDWAFFYARLPQCA